MLTAWDIDGTIDAEPSLMQSLMSAVKAAGHQVVVLTGCGQEKPEASDIKAKGEYLQSLGCAHCYDQLVVLGEPAAENKALWLKNSGADLLVDNALANAKAAAGICPVLVPWQSRKK